MFEIIGVEENSENTYCQDNNFGNGFNAIRNSAGATVGSGTCSNEQNWIESVHLESCEQVNASTSSQAGEEQGGPCELAESSLRGSGHRCGDNIHQRGDAKGKAQVVLAGLLVCAFALCSIAVAWALGVAWVRSREQVIGLKDAASPPKGRVEEVVSV